MYEAERGVGVAVFCGKNGAAPPLPLVISTEASFQRDPACGYCVSVRAVAMRVWRDQEGRLAARVRCSSCTSGESGGGSVRTPQKKCILKPYTYVYSMYKYMWKNIRKAKNSSDSIVKTSEDRCFFLTFRNKTQAPQAKPGHPLGNSSPAPFAGLTAVYRASPLLTLLGLRTRAMLPTPTASQRFCDSLMAAVMRCSKR